MKGLQNLTCGIYGASQHYLNILSSFPLSKQLNILWVKKTRTLYYGSFFHGILPFTGGRNRLTEIWTGSTFGNLMKNKQTSLFHFHHSQTLFQTPKWMHIHSKPVFGLCHFSRPEDIHETRQSSFLERRINSTSSWDQRFQSNTETDNFQL